MGIRTCNVTSGLGNEAANSASDSNFFSVDSPSAPVELEGVKLSSIPGRSKPGGALGGGGGKGGATAMVTGGGGGGTVVLATGGCSNFVRFADGSPAAETDAEVGVIEGKFGWGMVA